MYIIEDTRQKKGKHDIKHDYFVNNKITLIRSKLPFGDYMMPPKVVIDTKENMSEIAYNLSNGKNHARVREEVRLARDCGSRLIFLIENTDNIKDIEDVKSWVNPRRFESPGAIKGDRLYKIMKTMNERYGCEFMFCSPEKSGEIITKILKNE